MEQKQHFLLDSNFLSQQKYEAWHTFNVLDIRIGYYLEDQSINVT